MEKNKRVVGSVIQRSIVPKEVSTILNVATVPASDIGYQQSLKFAVNQLFGVASTDCLSDNEYDKALRVIARSEFWERLEHFYHQFYGPNFDMFFHEWYRYFRRFYKERLEHREEDKLSLANDILLCQLGGININNIPSPLFPYLIPYPVWPPDKNLEYIDKFLKDFGIKPEHFGLSLKIRTSITLVPIRVRASLEEIHKYKGAIRTVTRN